ncbi:MAG: hypothetical protein ACD_73C00577G0002 [uncultured bacterium]|nr:MAG: hypothetical protein ACD_73C00577G0002 [uncultured bacterium]
MIPRYTRPEMAKIWEPENKFKIWLEIELLALEGWANLGVVSKDIVKACRTKASFNVERIDNLERDLKHDVIAFLTSVAEFIGPEARHLHKGMTSSDVLDTCLAVQLKQASDLLIKDMDQLLSILQLRAQEFKNVPCMGRSHGIHAEPITFGLKLALWYDLIKRNRERLLFAKNDISFGKVSGAVGTFAHVDPSVEAFVCEKLGLKPEPVSTQVIQRDRHASFFATLSVVGGTIEQIATEIRHLQRTEVYEAEEFFSSGQKGSSAMPHKRNPVLSENVTGLARLLRGYALSALEDVALWHERDISHSSVERIIAPDATVTLDFMLQRVANIVQNLKVYPENMQKNLDKMHGLFYSQRVLLALTEKGVSREESYKLVQKNAMKVWEEGKDFLTELKNDPSVTRHLSPSDLDPLFDLSYYLRHVDTIFERVFGKDPS